MSTSAGARIADNLQRVQEQIADAARRSLRTADEISLVAVTKFVPAPVVRHLVAAGCRALGESRPQELWDKAAALRDLPIVWHLIGHLQRNKIRRTLPLTTLVQSVDSARLLAAIDAEAAALAIRSRVLLEVNVSGEAAKHGFAPEAVEAALIQAAGCPAIQVEGLMAMASLVGGAAVARRDFARLRELRDRLAARCPSGVSLAQLSMGMSSDFAEAIAEGATIVRIGSALFEGVQELADLPSQTGNASATGDASESGDASATGDRPPERRGDAGDGP